VPSVEPSAARRRASVPVPCATAPTLFERRLLHSHPQLKAAREDLLAGIRARLSENETELEQLRSVYSPRRDKK